MNKQKVEGSYQIAPPRGQLEDYTHTWDFARGGLYQRWSITASEPTLTLFPNHRVLVKQLIRLVSTETKFGGVRWWYICPECRNRVLYIYLPPGAHHFACRECHRRLLILVRQFVAGTAYVARTRARLTTSRIETYEAGSLAE